MLSYTYISVKEQRGRDLIDQLPDDQHKSYKYVEIGENYEISELSTQAFKTPNTNVGANSTDTIKHTKETVNYTHMVYSVIHLVSAQPKRQSTKFGKRLVHCAKVCRANINKKKPMGFKAQHLKDVILGSSPSVNRKLLTHILTNLPTHPHTHRHLSWAITAIG